MTYKKILLAILLLVASFYSPSMVLAKSDVHKKTEIIIKFPNYPDRYKLLKKAGFTLESLRELKSLQMVVTTATKAQKKKLTKLGLSFTENKPITIKPLTTAKSKTSQKSNNYMLDLGIYEFWKQGYRGKGVKVAVMDTGIDYRHKDLVIHKGVGIASTKEKIKYNDPIGHGTHVAGIISAKDNKIGAVGVAPEAVIYPVRVFNDNDISYIDDILYGIEWAISNKMDILNMSFGTEEDEEFLRYAIELAYDKGVITVASAGNKHKALNYPAAYPVAIAVGSVNNNFQSSRFSNYGKELDIVAPGENVYSTNLKSTYGVKSGTSMSTPIISGILALMKEAYPKLSWEQRMKFLYDSSIDLGKNGKDDIYGNGLPQVGLLLKQYPPKNYLTNEIPKKQLGSLTGTIRLEKKSKYSIPSIYNYVEAIPSDLQLPPLNAVLFSYKITSSSLPQKRDTQWGYAYEQMFYRPPIKETGNYKIEVYAMASGYEKSFLGESNFYYKKPQDFQLVNTFKNVDSKKIIWNIEAKVGKKAVKDAIVDLQITYPDKTTSVKKVSTKSNGTASVSILKVKKKGTYVVKAKVSKIGFATVTRTYTFKN